MNKFKIPIFLFLIFFLGDRVHAQDFRKQQKKFSRVINAYKEKEACLKQLLKEKNLPYPPPQIYIRIFKLEGLLQLWVRHPSIDSFQIFNEYKICSSSGDVGPKRQQGDRQVPEGFYWVDGFNPNSKFYLSLRINYPNEVDKILGVKRNLGGDIFIHGNCVTIGCIPITDDGIKELYLMAVEAIDQGQTRIPVHIFPMKFENGISHLESKFGSNENPVSFWRNLKEGYNHFEKHKRVPPIKVTKDGKYQYGR